MGFNFRNFARVPADDRFAAVTLSSGGTIQGRIVASDLDGRVTLQTPAGRITGRAVTAAPERDRGWLAELLRRGHGF